MIKVQASSRYINVNPEIKIVFDDVATYLWYLVSTITLLLVIVQRQLEGRLHYKGGRRCGE